MLAGDAMDKRLLTPTEAALLLAPTGATAKNCIQAALLSLLDAGRIAVEQCSNALKQPALLLIPPTAATAVPLPAHLAVVEQALLNYGKGNRLASSQVLHALQKRFGQGFGRYVHHEVAPSLMSRALLSRSDTKWLGLFPRIQYQRSHLGDDLAAPLGRLMAAVERLPSLVSRDPHQAIRLARSAGVLLVLSPKARRQIPKLRKLLAERGDDGASLLYVPLESDRVPKWECALELGDMALAFDLQSLFTAIDAVCDFISGADNSSDGGGDGGGGGD